MRVVAGELLAPLRPVAGEAFRVVAGDFRARAGEAVLVALGLARRALAGDAVALARVLAPLRLVDLVVVVLVLVLEVPLALVVLAERVARAGEALRVPEDLALLVAVFFFGFVKRSSSSSCGRRR